MTRRINRRWIMLPELNPATRTLLTLSRTLSVRASFDPALWGKLIRATLFATIVCELKFKCAKNTPTRLGAAPRVLLKTINEPTSDPPTVYMTVIMRVRYNTRSTGYGPYVVCNRDTEVVCPDIATRPYYSPQIRIIKPTDSDSIGGTRQISPMYGPMCRVPI